MREGGVDSMGGRKIEDGRRMKRREEVYEVCFAIVFLHVSLTSSYLDWCARCGL